MISRRSIFGGLAGLLVAPAIVKASSLMPVKATISATYKTRYFYGPEIDQRIIDMLNQTNEILAQLAWIEVPLDSPRACVRTGLPASFWRSVGR